MADQWRPVTTCAHCGAILYQLYEPQGMSYAPGDTFLWKDDNFNCQHEPLDERFKHEIHSRTDK